MRILVLGGTGAIGSAVVPELLRRGHRVSVLCRSPAAGEQARRQGAAAVSGSITEPDAWLSGLTETDAIIHLANGFGGEAAAVDAQLLTALFARGYEQRHGTLRMIYTGGMWLFGSREDPPRPGDRYAPPEPWQWTASGARRVLTQRGISGLVVHPANVVEERSGVPPLVLADARTHNTVRVPLPMSATWPLVRRETLARLYAEVVESGVAGMEYFGADEAAVPISDIVRRTATATGVSAPAVRIPIETWMEEYGAWTSGYALSQVAPVG